MPTEYFFWLAQPSSILNDYDWSAGYFFAGLLVLSILVWAIKKMFVRHEVIKKLLNKYSTALLWFGIVGLLWFAFRYQSIPIFSRRVYGGSIIVLGLIWLGFVKWYFVRHFFPEKREYDYNQVKNKYIR